MPVVNLAPIARKQYLDSNGDPVVGGLLFTYAAGSSTKQTTYTDSTGTTANTNPIILDASGRTPYGVWYEAGKIYKEVLALSTDTDPPGSPIYTADVLQGVNDTTTPAALAASSQWVASGLTPTYVSATQFTLVGDQTAAFHVGRRMRLTVTAGTVYGYISVSAFTTLTTLTVVLDSGALDSGLSAVDVGILTALNQSMPEPSSVGFQPLDAELTAIAGLTSSADTVPSFTGSGTAALLTLGTASGNIPKVGTKSATKILPGLNYDIPQIQPITATVATNALTLRLGPTTLDFRSATLTSGTVNTRQVAAAISLVVPDTATLGTVNATAARLVLLALDNAGTVELAVVNIAGGNNLDETTLISTTAITTGADSASVVYSTTARTSLPFRVVGFIDITEATAGTWATAPATVQGAGGQALAAMASLGYGQDWTDVKTSPGRSLGTTYTNSTGKPISVHIFTVSATAGQKATLTVNGVSIPGCEVPSNSGSSVSAIVPPGHTYVGSGGTGGSLSGWYELIKRE